MASVDKERLRARLLEHLGASIARLKASAEETRRGATHEESRPENDKDTRGLEASYLARGQAARVEEMQDDLKRLRFADLPAFDADRKIDLGALVTVSIHTVCLQSEEEDGTTRRLWLLPAGGGLELDDPDGPVFLVTPASPLGRALVEKREGDDFELRVAGGVREYVIEQVR